MPEWHIALDSNRKMIALALLTLKYKFGNEKDNYIGLDITRQDLASYTGTAYETFLKC